MADLPPRPITARTIVGAITDLRDSSGAPIRTADAVVRAVLKAGYMGGVFILVWIMLTTMIHDQRADLVRSIAAVEKLAAAVEANTIESRDMRTDLLSKIPDARPAARAVVLRPARQTR